MKSTLVAYGNINHARYGPGPPIASPTWTAPPGLLGLVEPVGGRRLLHTKRRLQPTSDQRFALASPQEPGLVATSCLSGRMCHMLLPLTVVTAHFAGVVSQNHAMEAHMAFCAYLAMEHATIARHSGGGPGWTCRSSRLPLVIGKR
jgi:hypothetical protein